ncbi:hypothetical protein N7474_004330 [Penicillium riverlandense]|uniref:uncharacterized protein n=1 Tax=Penicillium riverlandense TaxID=1903569 RepID=UPI0025472191|nr:uncharacterized protein N7474_004330 [Penicillium riverlandense]KAJ5818739.1 hypothetical protein N7474_004330 [Penicillium riverlandense]
MSDVEAVALPAALDVGQITAAVKVDGEPSVSEKVPESHSRPGIDREQAVESDNEGPPSPRADSEAETIIQSGRESLSPEKKRKHIRHNPLRQPLGDTDAVEGHLRKRPRIDGESRGEADRSSRSASPSQRTGPPLASVVKIEKADEHDSLAEAVPDHGSSKPNHRKRSSSRGNHAGSSEERATGPSRDLLKDVNNNIRFSPPSKARSVSPTRVSHARSASGSQVPSRKKAPTPLLSGFPRQASEDRQSTSSSASGSPLPSARLRKLGSGDGTSASPAKQMGPKKLRDKSGRTPLARACAERKYDQIVSLNGETEIVKFLLDAGCEINTKNIDKDTPLIDAVENGNVDVVKLLLEAGANPRTVNAAGDEPYELVPSELDDDDYQEMRKTLADAKASSRPGRRSEEHSIAASHSRRASGASPSPPLIGPRSPAQTGATGRRKTGRSEATRNDLLWTKPTLENLQVFASKGDEAGVVSILNILQKADTASLIAAAKGCHHDVLSLLYAMGNADSDPNPDLDHKPGYNTPMLAAIGRGKPAVVQLILNQPGFNPTRRLFENLTYYELARARQGEDWEEEYDMLKDAYDNYNGGDGRKGDTSSPRRARAKDKEDKRTARKRSSSPVARTSKKPNTSPNAARRRDPSAFDGDKEKRREKGKTVGSRGKASAKDASDSAMGGSDHDSRPAKSTASARRGSESSTMARNDEVKKRRLIAGRRPGPDQDRRPSLFSSDSLSGREETTKARADGPESLSSLKRIRADTSPERSRSRGSHGDQLSTESQKKKRRMLSEANANGASRKSGNEPVDADKPTSHDDPSRMDENTTRKSGEPSKKPVAPESSPKEDAVMENGVVKAEPQEPKASEVPTDEKRTEMDAEERQRAEVKKAEDERVAEERRVADEEERARLAKEEAGRAARAAREKAEEDERKRKEAEQRRIKQAEDERQKRLDQERARMAKVRRDQEELEQRRRDALPIRLRVAANFVGSNDPRARSHSWLKSFMPLVTALTKQLEPTCDKEMADEKWIPNYLVAPLLATNDLQLSQYASWEKRKATPTQRMNLWRVTRRMLIQADEPDFHDSSVGQILQKDCDTRSKYFDMEHVFWIRLSDFMDLVPHIPHLNGLQFQFLSMHIDQESFSGGLGGTAQPNGHAASVDTSSGSPSGLLNGYGHSRPSTYV